MSGNTDISAALFNKVDGKDYYSYKLPEESKVDGSYPGFRDLYLNGERLNMARSKEYEFLRTVDTYNEAEKTVYSNGFYVDKDFLNIIGNEAIALAELCMDIEWTSRRYRVSKITESDDFAKVFIKDEDWYSYDKFDGNKKSLVNCNYHFENHLSLLDEPGEFFYDGENGVIYLYPYKDTNMKTAVVSYPAIENIFRLSNTSGISFQGITFTGITSNFATKHGYNGGLGGVHSWKDQTVQADKTAGDFKNENRLNGWSHDFIPAAAIYSSNSDFFSVRNCTFDELGGNAVLLNGGNHSARFCDNSFTDIAMSAILAGKQSDSWSSQTGQTNIYIQNNYISNIGTDYNNCPAIYVTRAVGLYVTDNTILNTPYSGIMCGWITTAGEDRNLSSVEIAGNRLENNMFALNDGAAIYLCGANSLQSDSEIYNIIHDNYIKGNGYDMTYTGIYLDMNASNIKVYNNVIDGFGTTHGPVFNQDYISSQYTHNNIVTENYTTVDIISESSLSTADNSSYTLRNIKILGNIYGKTYDDLPVKAKKISKLSGVKKSIYIPKNKLVATLVLNSHETLPFDSERIIGKCVITNNGNDDLTFSLNSNNSKNFGISVMSYETNIKAGETRSIPLIFGCNEKKDALINLEVIGSNGSKISFDRAVKLRFSGKKVVNSDFITVPDSMKIATCDKGNKIELISDAVWYERVNLSKNFDKAYYYDLEKGFNLTLTDIVSSNDLPYSMVLSLSAESDAAWSDKAGYMLVYSSNGHLEIFKTPGRGTAPIPNADNLLVSVDREKLAESLTVNIRKVYNSYIFRINGISYEVPIADEFISSGATKYLCSSIGMLYGTKSDGTVDWEKNVKAGCSYIISELF